MTVAPRLRVSQTMSASLASQYSGSQETRPAGSSRQTSSALTTQ